ncbi:MAG TPA: Gfo/Idh/MocA family oxidoreductase [Verrucomicrobiota bacterium]|nr:Gfo/Idh/MocA family oxidoreductase [Verrucomicrobiota bacterium]
MNALLPRRRFLRHVVTGGTAMVILKNARSARSAEANQKLNIALVGVGGRGSWFTTTIPRLGENIVALCDVDDTKNPEAYERLSMAKRFRDFRKMLDSMGNHIDAVIVATPDHTHAVASAAAIRAGKHVFCEKPLTRTLHESRAVRDLSRSHKAATSMGNQGTAANPFRRALELIRNGTIGEVKEVHVWNSEGGADRKEPPKGGGPAPDFLDWDLWLGPAAFRPYHREWMNRNAWRDFGTCQLGNWGSHSVNLAFMALRVHELWSSPAKNSERSTIRIEAKHSGVNRLSFPKWEVVKWSIPARSGLPPITFTWHNGRAPGSRDFLENTMGEELDWGDKKEKKWLDHGGAIIIGTRGMVRATEHNATFRLLPKDQFEGIQTDRPEKVEASQGHERDWLRACRGGPPAWANFDYADALNEFLMLGNVATQIEPGTMLEFDPVAMRITNNPAADALLRCDYRQGWTL